MVKHIIVVDIILSDRSASDTQSPKKKSKDDSTSSILPRKPRKGDKGQKFVTFKLS